MNWYESPQAVNALASEYVLGTLRGRARRRFEAVMAQRPELADAVRGWEQRLHRMAAVLPPVAPSPDLWERLALQAGLPPVASAALDPTLQQPRQPTPVPTGPPTALPPMPASPVTPARPQPQPLARPQGGAAWSERLGRWLRAVLAPVPAGALAFGLMAGWLLPQALLPLQTPAHDTALPESYVGVLATADGRPGLIVASLRHGRSVDLKQVVPVVPPPGQTLFLWTLDADGVTRPVGPVPHGPFVQAPLADTAETVFRQAVELGVTLEPVGRTPSAPSAWVYRGLCGKVWRVPPAAPPAAASR